MSQSDCLDAQTRAIWCKNVYTVRIRNARPEETAPPQETASPKCSMIIEFLDRRGEITPYHVKRHSNYQEARQRAEQYVQEVREETGRCCVLEDEIKS